MIVDLACALGAQIATNLSGEQHSSHNSRWKSAKAEASSKYGVRQEDAKPSIISFVSLGHLGLLPLSFTPLTTHTPIALTTKTTISRWGLYKEVG